MVIFVPLILRAYYTFKKITLISLEKINLNTKLGKMHFQFPAPPVITFFYIFEQESVQI